ncbi:Phosphotransferase enzyme family protein [Roseivivax jejudonensis]|uniref:Phosphotransferase enzyme family protein n=1 Tax=Roseivivax jejudonensis TaxID=1529041 RepID=A0A1X6YLB4_9RHOB|nr:phosphotransferase [Roseivivax jejudonensis]SLN24614.1 Phosphotransferase enzyme family protein [Roseivivax jejudonensis]
MTRILQDTGWRDADAQPLAGDASSRRYTRLSREGARAILMEDPDGDVTRFARLAEWLRGIGLSAPEILGIDADAGTMLLEDLGDDLFARLASTDPGREEDLYRVAADVLVTLHSVDPPEGLLRADPAFLAAQTDLAFDWYLARAGAPDQGLKAEVAAVFETILERHAPEPRVCVLRDYHAENMIWLPAREGAARAGLLDFQDAVIGHPAYDLVSLIEDARRDVAPAAAAAARSYYLSHSGETPEAFGAAYAALGAQRNLRILGVFARLAATRGKPGYIDLIPRVWRHLKTDLAHPALAPLVPLLTRLPAPEPACLDRLRPTCPTP